MIVYRKKGAILWYCSCRQFPTVMWQLCCYSYIAFWNYNSTHLEFNVFYVIILDSFVTREIETEQ